MEPPAAAVIAQANAACKVQTRGASIPLRRRLAWTMALDTLSALSVPLQLALVVSDQPALEAQLRRAGIAAEVISERGSAGV